MPTNCVDYVHSGVGHVITIYMSSPIDGYVLAIHKLQRLPAYKLHGKHNMTAEAKTTTTIAHLECTVQGTRGRGGVG